MTDNEKAATFLGWRRGLAPAAAPDMTRPENYMRALDNLQCQWVLSTCETDPFSPHLKCADIYGCSPKVYWQDADTGVAVQTALARYYDRITKRAPK